MPSTALTSAEISLPGTADAGRVRERIATLADTVDLVGLTDNHAGQPRMSPLAAVALAREQGVGTIVHVSCRDRNRLALQSQVVGAVALGSEGVRASTVTRLREFPASGTSRPHRSLRPPSSGPSRTSSRSARSSTPSRPILTESWPCWSASSRPGRTSSSRR